MLNLRVPKVQEIAHAAAHGDRQALAWQRYHQLRADYLDQVDRLAAMEILGCTADELHDQVNRRLQAGRDFSQHMGLMRSAGWLALVHMEQADAWTELAAHQADAWDLALTEAEEIRAEYYND